MSYLGDLGTFLKGERDGVTLELDNKLNAIAPYSGYLAVAKKLDNFYFQTNSNFIASMADKNRYVKFLDKVVDTWSNTVQTTSTQTANATATTLTMSNTTGLTVGKVIAILKGDLLVHTSVITAVSTNVSITVLNSFNREVTAYKIKIIQSINLANYVPDVLVQDEATNGLIIQSSVNAGDMVVVDRIVQTGAELYRAKIDAPIGTSLTNTTYFEVRDSIVVTNQIGVFHRYNLLTDSYEGLSAEVLFSDVSKEDLLDNPVWLSRNGFSKAGEYCYSKGTYLYLPISVEQLGNKGLYHQFLNSRGAKKASDDLFWYNTAQTFTSLADCFNTAKLLTSSGNITSGKSGRPDGKYFDVLYSDRSQDVREYAKILNKFEVDLIRADKEENGVSETTFIEQVTQTTTGTVATLEVGNGANYRLGSVLQIWNGTTPYRRYVVNVSGNTVTLDSAIVKTAIPFIINGGKLPLLSSNTKLSTDLIGNPTNYPQIMKDRLAEGKGIIGVNPLLVSDTGVSLIPDGSFAKAKLSNKWVIEYNCIYTDNNITYGSIDKVYNSITNDVDFVLNTVGRLYYMNYTSKNLPYIQTTPKNVVEVLPKVKASNSHSIYKGALVGNQVSGKIQVGNGANGYESKVLENILLDGADGVIYPNIAINVYQNKFYKFIGFDNFDANKVYKRTASDAVANYASNYTSTAYEYQGSITSAPTHSTIALDNSNSPASKWFECLEEGSNGVLAGVYGKELVWDYSKDTASDINDISGTTPQSYTADTLYEITGLDNPLVVLCVTTSASLQFNLLQETAVGFVGNSTNILYFKKWDGNGFGDNDKFDQLTNGTKTDINGNTVRTFHGSIAINGRIK